MMQRVAIFALFVPASYALRLQSETRAPPAHLDGSIAWQTLLDTNLVKMARDHGIKQTPDGALAVYNGIDRESWKNRERTDANVKLIAEKLKIPPSTTGYAAIPYYLRKALQLVTVQFFLLAAMTHLPKLERARSIFNEVHELRDVWSFGNMYDWTATEMREHDEKKLEALKKRHHKDLELEKNLGTINEAQYQAYLDQFETDWAALVKKLEDVPSTFMTGTLNDDQSQAGIILRNKVIGFTKAHRAIIEEGQSILDVGEQLKAANRFRSHGGYVSTCVMVQAVLADPAQRPGKGSWVDHWLSTSPLKDIAEFVHDVKKVETWKSARGQAAFYNKGGVCGHYAGAFALLANAIDPRFNVLVVDNDREGNRQAYHAFVRVSIPDDIDTECVATPGTAIRPPKTLKTCKCTFLDPYNSHITNAKATGWHLERSVNFNNYDWKWFVLMFSSTEKMQKFIHEQNAPPIHATNAKFKYLEDECIQPKKEGDVLDPY